MQMKKAIALILSMVVLAFGILGSSIPTVNAKSVSTLETILNNAQLNPEPVKANRSYVYNNDRSLEELWDSTAFDEALNAYTNSILSAITTPEMTTYQKVKACYDWIIETYNYGDWDDGYGLMTCTGYTTAFVYLTRTIGLESYYVYGDTHAAAGGYTGHTWPIIVIDGVEYIFDAQIDDNIAKGEKIGYYRFGKTYDEVPGKYIVQGSAAIKQEEQYITQEPVTFEQEEWSPDGSSYSYTKITIY